MENYYASLTVPQLRERILADHPNRTGLSKLRKGELITLLRELEDQRAVLEAEPEFIEGSQTPEEGREQARQWYDPSVGEPKVFQGAMHEATTPDTIGDTLRVLSGSLAGVGEKLTKMARPMRDAARKLGVVAWANRTAVIRSMGRTVRGKVVDTVLRTPGPDGTGRVCLVVQHDGHPTRRTLHALADVKFKDLAS